MIITFNIFDTLGRFAGGKWQFVTPKTVIFLTLGRVVFIATFVLVGFNLPFNQDWFKLLNMALFSITNGYNSTVLMGFGPSLVKDEHKERAGIIMSFHLTGGIFAGSFVAIAMGSINFPPTFE